MKPKYQMIIDDLKSQIFIEKYEVGKQIPTEFQLQEKYQVSRHTVRKAIEGLIQEGYLRSEKGSGTYVSNRFKIKNQRSGMKTVGLILTYISDYIFPSIIRGIEKELKKYNYSLILASTNNDFNQEKAALEQMLAAGVEGIIIEPTQSNLLNPNLSYYSLLLERNIPITMINANYDELDLSLFSLDDVASGYLATKYLLDKGHRHIGLITKVDDSQGKYRTKGYVQAMTESNVTFASEMMLTFNTAEKDDLPSKIKKYLLHNQSRLDSIVCYNDEIAAEVYKVAKVLNLKIPNDLSLIGQDDAPLASFLNPGLTTLTHPKEKLGQEAAAWLIHQIVEEKKGIKRVTYSPTLIERESVK